MAEDQVSDNVEVTDASEPNQSTATPETDTNTPAASSEHKQKPVAKKPKKWLLPAVAAVAVLVLGGGAYGYFGVYTQSASYIWDKSLKKTGEGLKAYFEQQPSSLKSAKITGTFKLTTPVAADGTLMYSSDGSNTQFTTSMGAAGVRAELEVRGIKQENANNPDLYVKVDGVKGLSALLGSSASEIAPILDSVDGKWFSVDHTLLDQATASIKTSNKKLPSTEELQKDMLDLSKAMSAVVSDRLFTTDDAKAVAIIKDKLAKEDFKGRKTQHITVQVRKQQTKDFVVALKDTVKNSKVKDLLISDGAGKTFEEAINFDSMLKDLDKADYDKMIADVWLDTGLQYVRNVRIPIEDNNKKTTGSIDFTLDYKGGDDYPMSITITNKDKEVDGSITIGVTLKKASTDATMTFGLDMTTSGQKVQGSAEFKLTGSNDAVKVEKPAGATNIMNLLGSYMSQIQQLGSGLGALSDSSSTAAQASSTCLTEYQAYLASGGQTALSAACQAQDDTEL